MIPSLHHEMAKFTCPHCLCLISSGTIKAVTQYENESRTIASSFKLWKRICPTKNVSLMKMRNNRKQQFNTFTTKNHKSNDHHIGNMPKKLFNKLLTLHVNFDYKHTLTTTDLADKLCNGSGAEWLKQDLLFTYG